MGYFMSDTTKTILSLIAETRRITLKQDNISPGVVQVGWTIPADTTVLDGIIIMVSNTPYNSSMTPVSGQRYTADTNIPAFAGNKIGDAYVVYRSHKILGQPLLTEYSVAVLGLDPTQPWYAFAFGVSNTFQYSSSPIYGYLLDEDMANQSPDTFAGAIEPLSSAPDNPYVGQVYYNVTTGHVQVWIGASWIDASSAPIPVGASDAIPTAPAQGDFFYNSTTRQLLVWNGTSWNRADVSQPDSPMVEKLGVGTDGSYDERARLIDVLKIQLGSPTVCVELGEEAFDVAIDNALDEFRRRADNAYNMRYVIFEIKPGQSHYYLNDPRTGSNRVVNIIKIHRVNTMGIGSISGDMTVYAQSFFQSMYTGGGFDILSIHLMASLSEEYQRIFAGDLAFLWDESTRQLQILRTVNTTEKVILECAMERTEQDLLVDRWAKQWLQHWAHSELIEQLGLIRSKFGNLPGAGGGITLNGSELLAMAESMQTEALRQLSDFEAGNGGVNFGNSAFLLG